MGIKISDMTLTGSAPADSYIPLAHNGENYKVTASTVRNSANQIVTGSYSLSDLESVDIKIGDLQGADQIFISASFRFFGSTGSVSIPLKINGSYGVSDSGGLKMFSGTGAGVVLSANDGTVVNIRGHAGLGGGRCIIDIGASGDEVFIRAKENGFIGTKTLYWSYLNL